MEYMVISESGDREINEDCARAASFGGMHGFVLCDGLGGHGKGEVASATAAEAILAYLREHPVMSPSGLAAAFETAQSELLRKQQACRVRSAMKTTAVALLTDGTSAVWAHIGDSRLYLFHKNKVVLRTLDHSVPQMLVLTGEIREKQIRTHPDRNRLLRVMGTEWGAQRYEVSEVRGLAKCQAFLLCSDGFWEYITEKTMGKLLKQSQTAAQWLSLMTEEVRANGAATEMDNYSAIAVIL